MPTSMEPLLPELVPQSPMAAQVGALATQFRNDSLDPLLLDWLIEEEEDDEDEDELPLQESTQALRALPLELLELELELELEPEEHFARKFSQAAWHASPGELPGPATPVDASTRTTPVRMALTIPTHFLIRFNMDVPPVQRVNGIPLPAHLQAVLVRAFGR